MPYEVIQDRFVEVNTWNFNGAKLTMNIKFALMSFTIIYTTIGET